MKSLSLQFTLLIFVVSILPSHSQQKLEVSLEDKLILTGDTYRGDIQWQSSLDREVWTDCRGGTVNDFELVIGQSLTYYRAKVEEASCATPHFSEIIEVESNTITKLWSDPNTWGQNGKPKEGDEVTIPEGDYIILDESPPNLGGLIINGSLAFDRLDLELTSEWIIVNGTLRIGTAENPFSNKAIITLNDQDTEFEAMNMGTRGIMAMTGSLELHGTIPDVIWTKLDEHAEAGATNITVLEEVDWKAGDEIIIAPTDYYEAGFGASETQVIEASEIDGKKISLNNGLNAHRWGLLQYPTMDGLILTADNAVSPPMEDTDTTTTPLVLDERAEVGNLTRNIVIQAADDELWADGFGVHTMIMPQATAHIEGVEFKRAGQRGRIRRYAFHWHMLSYEGSETLEDATGQYFRGNTINRVANRGIVIHGTNGVLVQDNIVYDTRGHGIFTEDAVERRNIIDHNLILHVRNPAYADRLMLHEVSSGGAAGSSGMWLANPDNVVINNTVADCQNFGYWLAFPNRPFGLSSEVLHTDGLPLRPSRLRFGVFDNNTAHSNRSDGVHIDNPQVDDEGRTFTFQYHSTTDGRTDVTVNNNDHGRRFSLSRIKTWKNMDNGSWDRGILTDMYEFVSADNCGRFFAGSGAEGVIQRCLIVGTSLNFMMNGTGRPEEADFQFYTSAAPTAFATYHSAFSMHHNIVVNFKVTEYDRAGVFATDDYYFRPVDKGQVRNHDNLLIESDPGVKLKPLDNYFSFASALWDPYGHWGPEENYLVYKEPFFTFEKEIFEPALGADIVGGVSVEGPFYGFLNFILYGTVIQDIMAIHVDRLNPNNLDEVIGTWDVAEAQPSWSFQHMRDFATTPEGIYELSFPGVQVLPTDYRMDVENMLTENDLQVLSVPFDGSIDPYVLIRQESNVNNWTLYEMVNSREEVINSVGETWWQDKENNKMWIKIRGGRWEATPQDVGSFEAEANETMFLEIGDAN